MGVAFNVNYRVATRIGEAWRRNLFRDVRRQAATRPVFNADLYVIDGGSGKTRAVVDHNDLAHWLDQSNTTLQCALPAAHADFAGKLCFSMIGDLGYVSNRAASYWSVVHQSGVIYDLTTPIATSTTQVVWETTSNFATSFLQRFWASTQTTHRMRPQASPVATTDALPGNGAAGTPQVDRTRVTSTNIYAKKTGASEQTGVLAAAPDSSSPSRGLGFGRVGLVSNFRAAIPFAAFPALDAAGTAIVEQWIQQTYGLAA